MIKNDGTVKNNPILIFFSGVNSKYWFSLGKTKYVKVGAKINIIIGLIA